MTFLFVLSASAHVPHDTVGYFAAPADLSSDGAWWVGDLIASDVVFDRSTDGGTSWSRYTDGPADYYISDLAMDEAGNMVAGLGTFYMYTSDDGDTWSGLLSNSADSIDDMAGGDRIWFATDNGIYDVSDLEAPVLAQSGDFNQIVADGALAAAVDASGNPWVWDGTSWSSSSPPIGVRATAISEDGAYFGSRTGRVYTNASGSWVQCGSLDGEGESHAQVLHMAVDQAAGDHLVVLTGLGGPYISTDGCATWLDRTVPLAPAYGPRGSVRTTVDAYSVLAVYDGEYVVGGWAGLYHTNNLGVIWTEASWLVTAFPSGGGSGGISGPDAVPDEAADPAEDSAGGCGAAGSAMVLAPLFLLGLRRRRG